MTFKRFKILKKRGEVHLPLILR